MAYIKAVKRQIRRSFPDSILVAARDPGGKNRSMILNDKNRPMMLWVSIPKEWLRKAFGEIPKKVNVFWNDESPHDFLIKRALKGGTSVRQTSKNLCVTWVHLRPAVSYFNNIDYGESDIITIKNGTIHFEVEERLKDDC
jgi:hypothetical protein